MSNAQILSELHTNCTYLPFFEAHIPAGFLRISVNVTERFANT